MVSRWLNQTARLYDRYYWFFLLTAICFVNVTLGISTYLQAEHPTNAATAQVLGWVPSPLFYLVWASLAFPAWLYTIVKDPYFRVNALHFSSSGAHMAGIFYISLTSSALSTNVTIGYGFILFVYIAAFMRSLLWNYNKEMKDAE